MRLMRAMLGMNSSGMHKKGGKSKFQSGKGLIEDNLPGDSKCPFHPLVGGHLTPWKGHLTIPKRSLWITRWLLLSRQHLNHFVYCLPAAFSLNLCTFGHLSVDGRAGWDTKWRRKGLAFGWFWRKDFSGWADHQQTLAEKYVYGFIADWVKYFFCQPWNLIIHGVYTTFLKFSHCRKKPGYNAMCRMFFELPKKIGKLWRSNF